MTQQDPLELQSWPEPFSGRPSVLLDVAQSIRDQAVERVVEIVKTTTVPYQTREVERYRVELIATLRAAVSLERQTDQ